MYLNASACFLPSQQFDHNSQRALFEPFMQLWSNSSFILWRQISAHIRMWMHAFECKGRQGRIQVPVWNSSDCQYLTVAKTAAARPPGRPAKSTWPGPARHYKNKSWKPQETLHVKGNWKSPDRNTGHIMVETAQRLVIFLVRRLATRLMSLKPESWKVLRSLICCLLQGTRISQPLLSAPFATMLE